MCAQRLSGLLLHPTSLPSPYGIGDLGEVAYRFVEFLSACKQSIWQILPLGPTGFGNSPYQCFSAFAGNALLVSPELLRADGLLSAEDLAETPDFPERSIDFETVRSFRWELLRKAAQRWPNAASDALKERHRRFVEDNKS